VSKIETGRYSELLRKALGMKGQQTVAAELSPELSPTWQLEGPTLEWEFLKSVKHLASAERINPNVAGAGQMRLLNPVNSGVLAVVDLVTFNAGATLEYTIRIIAATAGLLNSALTVATDTRWETVPAGQQSALLVTFQNITTIGVGSGTIFRPQQLVANAFNRFDIPVVLTPGFALDFGSRNANQTVSLGVYWHERQLPPLET